MEANNNEAKLQRTLKPVHVWSLALGSIIGWGAFVVYEKTPRSTRGSVNAMHLTRNPPSLKLKMRSANCIKFKKEDYHGSKRHS